jgi:hypothetical protein
MRSPTGRVATGRTESAMDNDDQSDAFTPYIAEPEIIDRHAAGSVRLKAACRAV